MSMVYYLLTDDLGVRTDVYTFDEDVRRGHYETLDAWLAAMQEEGYQFESLGERVISILDEDLQQSHFAATAYRARWTACCPRTFGEQTRAETFVVVWVDPDETYDFLLDAPADALSYGEASRISDYNDFLKWLHDERGLDFVRREDGAVQDGYAMGALSHAYTLKQERD